MPKLQDRVQESTTTTGTGSFALNGAVTGYITFNAGFTNGDIVWYVCDDGAGNWEIGYGTVGTGTLTRTVFQSSNSNNLVVFGVGTKRIFCTAPYTYLLPDQTGNSGTLLTTDGSSPSWSNTISSLNVTGNTTLGDASSDTVTLTGTVQPGVVISGSSSGDALRITQTGAGNALVVEDSTNPDASPFVIDSSGLLVQGNSSPLSIAGNTSAIQQHGLASQTSTISSVRWQSASSAGPQYIFGKSKSGVVGTYSALSSGDVLGTITFVGDDGTSFVQAAQIFAAVDGTPGTNDMPGRLVFSTTADGASSPTERMRIDNAGQVGVGVTPTAGRTFTVGKNLTGATASNGIRSSGAIQSDVTSSVSMFVTFPSTQATTFTLASLSHYEAGQSTIGAGSTVTNQYGFNAASSLTGATNNYGFYSNIASGTGRYNFYAAGSASNYFGGDTTISASSSNAALRITQTGAGNALLVEDEANPDSTPFVVKNNGAVIAGNTSSISGTITPIVQSVLSADTAHLGAYTFAASTSGPILEFGQSASNTIGTQAVVASGDNLGFIRFSGSDGTNFIRGAQIGAQVDGTPGTNDMPGRLVFSTTADGASSPTERMRIDNAGRVGIGGTPATTQRLVISGTQTLGATNQIVLNQQTIQSDATSLSIYFDTYANTAAASFTLTNLRHYRSAQGTFGAGSTVTNQAGFYADASLTGATNNYGFYSNIASGTGRYNFYAAGTADNYFAGKVGVGGLPYTTTQFNISGTHPGTGGTNYGAYVDTTIPATNTFQFATFQTAPNTTASAFTLTGLFHYQAGQGTIGATSAVTNQYGFSAQSSLTGATNNYGFYSNISSGTGRYNFYAAGTADNYFAGKVGVGGLALTGETLALRGSVDTTATIFGFRNVTVVDQATSTTVYGISDQTGVLSPAALTNLSRFYAAAGSFTGTVTNQFGFHAQSTLTGATNNYGFYSAIASGTGRYNFYAAGTAENYFAGKVGIGTTASTGTLEISASNSTPLVFGNSGGTSAFLVLRNTSTTSNNTRIGAETNDLTLYTAAAERMRVDANGNIYPTSGTTGMTNGFFYIPAAGGAPSGTPTAVSGRVPMYYDTTNNKFYIYNGAWKSVTLA